jgi:hypothetical protein
MSEFGACLDSEVCGREITQVADVCEDWLLGWSYWQYKTYKDLTTSAGNKSEGFYNVDGSLQNVKVKALSRPYVPLAQGEIIKNKLDHASGNFSATIQVDTTINAPTVVFANTKARGDAWYPNGFNHQVTDDAGNLVEVDIANDGDVNRFQF